MGTSSSKEKKNPGQENITARTPLLGKKTPTASQTSDEPLFGFILHPQSSEDSQAATPQLSPNSEEQLRAAAYRSEINQMLMETRWVYCQTIPRAIPNSEVCLSTEPQINLRNSTSTRLSANSDPRTSELRLASGGLAVNEGQVPGHRRTIEDHSQRPSIGHTSGVLGNQVTESRSGHHLGTSGILTKTSTLERAASDSQSQKLVSKIAPRASDPVPVARRQVPEPAVGEIMGATQTKPYPVLTVKSSSAVAPTVNPSATAGIKVTSFPTAVVKVVTPIPQAACPVVKSPITHVDPIPVIKTQTPSQHTQAVVSANSVQKSPSPASHSYQGQPADIKPKLPTQQPTTSPISQCTSIPLTKSTSKITFNFPSESIEATSPASSVPLEPFIPAIRTTSAVTTSSHRKPSPPRNLPSVQSRQNPATLTVPGTSKLSSEPLQSSSETSSLLLQFITPSGVRVYSSYPQQATSNIEREVAVDRERLQAKDRTPPQNDPTPQTPIDLCEFNADLEPNKKFSSLREYKTYFLDLLEVEREEVAKEFNEKLTDLPFSYSGNIGKVFSYTLNISDLLNDDSLASFRETMEDFMFGDEFYLVYGEHKKTYPLHDHSCPGDTDYKEIGKQEIEMVRIAGVDEITMNVEFHGRYPCATEIRYYQSLPHKRMVQKMKYLSSKHPLINLILGSRSVENQQSVTHTYLPKAHINTFQAEAIINSMNAKISLIHGPPGSGKTTVAAELVKSLSKIDKKILVCAPSNVATDNLAIRMKELNLSVLRVYSKALEEKSNIADQFAFHTYIYGLACAFFNDKVSQLRSLDFYSRSQISKIIGQDEMKSLEIQVLGHHQIICCTCSASADKLFSNFNFDTVLVDEAAFSCEPETMIPISMGCNRIVLVGDPKQLRPIIKSEEYMDKGLKCSMFERLSVVNVTPSLLAIQYRMHQDISSYPNKAFYGGRLINGITEEGRSLKSFTVNNWFKTSRVLVLNSTTFDSRELQKYTEKKSKKVKKTSVSNEGEAQVVINVIYKLVNELDVHLNSIGVISAYKLQEKRLIRLAIDRLKLYPRDIEIKSIDAYQGREKDFIVISCVRSNSEGKIGFLRDVNRINVALTRAKYGLIVICNATTLETRNSVWSGFINSVRERKGYFEASDFIGKAAPKHTGKFGFL